jgi:uncharacterized cupredoxin-like copper-binding protein
MRLPGALILAAVLALLSGCGGPDPVRADGGTIRLRIDEYRMLPREIRVTGPKVRIVMTDRGILTHNVKVFSTTEVDAEDKPIEIGTGTPTAHPGETMTSEVFDLKPGRYRLACSIANHDDLGEHALLIVGGRS